MIQNSDFILKTINGSSYLLPTGQDGLWHMLSIVGLTFSLYGENTSFSPALLPFATNTMFAFPDNAAPIKAADCGTSRQNVPDQTVLVLAGTPATAGNGSVLLHNKELIVKDASFFCIYCIPSEKGSLQDVLFHVLRSFRHFRHCFPSSGRYCVPEAGYFRFCRRTLPGRTDFVPDKPHDYALLDACSFWEKSFLCAKTGFSDVLVPSALYAHKSCGGGYERVCGWVDKGKQIKMVVKLFGISTV